MRVGIYVRVSTCDNEQDPVTQFLPLRDFVRDQGWEIYHEYQDHAPATDLLHRAQWRQLLEDTSKRKFDLLLVFRMDRAFRSVLDAATTLEKLRAWRVGFRSYSEPWVDTTSPFGEALYAVTAAYVHLEHGILRERVMAGVQKARQQGHQIGRPRVMDRPGFQDRYGAVLECLRRGEISRCQAAKVLDIGYATLKRFLDKEPVDPPPGELVTSTKESS